MDDAVSPPPKELGSLVNAVHIIIGNSFSDVDLNVPIFRAVSTAAAIPHPITNNIAITVSIDDGDDLPPPHLPYDKENDDDWKKRYDPRYQAWDGFPGSPHARDSFYWSYSRRY